MTAEQVRAVLLLYDERRWLQEKVQEWSEKGEREVVHMLVARLVRVEASIATLEARGRLTTPSERQ